MLSMFMKMFIHLCMSSDPYISRNCHKCSQLPEQIVKNAISCTTGARHAGWRSNTQIGVCIVFPLRSVVAARPDLALAHIIQSALCSDFSNQAKYPAED